jgi:hypothetical protein
MTPTLNVRHAWSQFAQTSDCVSGIDQVSWAAGVQKGLIIIDPSLPLRVVTVHIPCVPLCPLHLRASRPHERPPHRAATVSSSLIMSNSTFPTPTPQVGMTQSQTDVLGPGIAGLLIQGVLSGLVLGQFCRWFSAAERNDSTAFSLLVVFVTGVGL